jgi:apolipoprotein N-acyltransferase
LLLGSIAFENEGTEGETWFNAAFVADPVAGVQTNFYAKRHLVPFGEYVPLRPLLGWLNKFVEVGDSDFTPGPDASPLMVSLPQGSIAIGPLICYEDIFPQLARGSVIAGSEVLAVLTNNAWYGEGGAAYQHAAHAVLRAVETRRPVLRCGNGGWSGWIDEFGSVRATVLNDAGTVYFRGTQTVDVKRDARWVGRQSFYVQHGDWFVAASALAALLAYGALRLGRVVTPPVAEGEATVSGR